MEGGALEKKPHLVNWIIVGLGKQDVGLGIQHLSMLNKALLGEWILKVCNRKRVPIKVNHNR